MEENREQPTIEPATTLDKVNENRAVSDVGSQDLGKFKSPQALLEAYNNLQAEFTRKSQLLKSLQKDKIDSDKQQIQENFEKREENSIKNQENLQEIKEIEEIEEKTIEKENEALSQNSDEQIGDDQEYEEKFSQFLLERPEAEKYADEIKSYLESNLNNDPFENALANVILSHIKTKKIGDPIIDEYVLSNEQVKNKIIENYLSELANQKPPVVMSSQGGERVSGVLPDSPKTLAEAKRIVNNMFS